ncbi:unnamed protein product [Lampetra planeri]
MRSTVLLLLSVSCPLVACAPASSNSSTFSASTISTNASALNSSACLEWEESQHGLFQFANTAFLVAYLIPATLSCHILLFRGLMILGCIFWILWATLYQCAYGIGVWGLVFLIICAAHAALLLYNMRLVKLPPELSDLYVELFAPLNVPREVFRSVVSQYCMIETRRRGEVYALENKTPIDRRLSILLKGKMKVTCQGRFLHFIYPNAFIDSVEYRMMETQKGGRSQVSISAMDDCQLVSWSQERLIYFLKTNPFLEVVFASLIGRDITNKIYALKDVTLTSRSMKKISSHPGLYAREVLSIVRRSCIPIQVTNTTTALAPAEEAMSGFICVFTD